MEEAEEKQKNMYELSFLLKSEGDFPAIIALLTQHQASVTLEGPMRQLTLAYPIKKNDKAVFGTARFEAKSETVKGLEHDLRTVAPVLRSLILRLPLVKDQVFSAKSRSYATVAPKVFVEKKLAAPVLSNEALEKKIEEILQ